MDGKGIKFNNLGCRLRSRLLNFIPFPSIYKVLEGCSPTPVTRAHCSDPDLSAGYPVRSRHSAAPDLELCQKGPQAHPLCSSRNPSLLSSTYPSTILSPPAGRSSRVHPRVANHGPAPIKLADKSPAPSPIPPLRSNAAGHCVNLRHPRAVNRQKTHTPRGALASAETRSCSN